MIKFSNWYIENSGSILARQYDNLTSELRIEGDIPSGYTWELLVQFNDSLNVIALTYTENALYVTLTADILALSGYYVIQLRATQDEKVRHTNIIQVYIPESLSGDAQWPELPTEFSQAEDRIRELNLHPPIPGDEGFWLTWDLETQQYIKSEFPLPDVAIGADGGYYTPSVKQLTETTMTVSFVASKEGMPPVAPVQVTLPRGKQGDPGTPGNDGVSPQASVQQTATGATITIIDKSGTTKAEVKNGKDGQQGPPGADGKDGSPGVDGKTPEKGVDYWTEADKQEIVVATVAALPVYNGEVQDVG